MSEVEAYYKIFPHLTLKYSSLDTIFIPTDKKELRSKFLKKINEDDTNFAKGIEVAGARTGKFIEKPDIIDKFCRRDISEKILNLMNYRQFNLGNYMTLLDGKQVMNMNISLKMMTLMIQMVAALKMNLKVKYISGKMMKIEQTTLL